jgi:hypothetical protein
LSDSGETFYRADGDGFVATEATRGPWSEDHQHGGPPAALLGRAIAAAAGADWQLVRIAFELPRPIPIARLTIELEAEAGQRVARHRAALLAGTKEVMRASALAIRGATVDLGALPAREPAPAAPESLPESPLPFFHGDRGYHRSVTVRFAAGGYGQGRSIAWIRSDVPLVAGEALSPLERVLIAADSGNGVSSALPHEEYLFINPDLSVHLHRLPAGEWVGLEAVTLPETSGVGIAHSRLFDTAGPIGYGLQSLLIARRSPPAS